MPAQILPMVDGQNDQQNTLAFQRQQQQADYQNQLLGLEKAKFENDRALNPLRQQLMAQDLQNKQQAGQQAMEAWAQQKALGPDMAREQKAKADSAETMTGSQKINQQILSGELGNQPNAFKQKADESRALVADRTQSAATAKTAQDIDIRKMIIAENEAKIKAIGGNQEIAKGGVEGVKQLAALIQTIGDAPPDQRQAPLDALYKTGQISVQTYNRALENSYNPEDRQKEFAYYLGGAAAAQYKSAYDITHRLTKTPEVEDPNSKTVSLAKNPYTMEQDKENMAKLVSLEKRLLDARALHGQHADAPTPPVGDDGKIDESKLIDGGLYKTTKGTMYYDKGKGWRNVTSGDKAEG